MSGSDINKVNSAISSTSEVNPQKSSLVELKNGKVYFKQKPTSFEKQSETLQEIVKFREMLEERIKKQAPPLTAIPEEHRPLIAKLAHESDKTLATLSKHIYHQLIPAQDEDEEHNSASSAFVGLPLAAVETAVKTIVQRNNYGLDGIGGSKAPAALCVWRWEVKMPYQDWLPKNGREKAEARLAERIQAKQDLLSIFNALPQEEQDTILSSKGNHKVLAKETADLDTSKTIDLTGENSARSSPQKSPKKQGETEGNDSEATSSKATRIKKPIDPEKVAKEKERLEKKAAKAEKDRKEKDAQDKSRSLMANFFAKPKATTQTLPKEAALVAASSSNTQSDFEKSFKPFVIKKDVHLAPINWFLEPKNLRGSSIVNDIIIIDDDEVVKEESAEIQDTHTQEIDVTKLDAKDHLRSIISALPSPVYRLNHHISSRRSPRLKTYHALSVRDVISQLSEAEIAGDISMVRSLLSKLSNRSLFPAKVFIFKEDARPGYFGTWTRNSRIIGPRTPFAKDVLVFDYSYDSGEEWEEEPAGDADDVVDDGEDEDIDGEDADSDLESWLVDDDEEPYIITEDMDMTPPPIPALPQVTKRKAEENEKTLGKKRKTVIPLVPFARGPCWESSIGQCDYELFKPYRIQLFNDTPLSIDPFTFVSSCLEDRQLNSTNDGVFAIPILPERVAVDLPSGTYSPLGSNATTAKKILPVPKAPFPDVHLPLLLGKITALQATSITFLVEAIHHELREHKIKKNAIEAKVRELCEKCKQKKVWIVKSGVQTTC